MKKLLVVDGNSILNRAFYGIRPLTTKDGKNTNAVYGMIGILHRHITALSPDYAAVTFDVHAPTFRKLAYEPYKANRKPCPPELSEQFDYAKECLSAMGLTVLEKEGYEADDLQGTLATLAAESEDTEAYILSGDRDLLQLISEKIRVLLAGNKETVCFDREVFFEKYGIEPQELIEAKALMGDSSDNIPGVAGIGEKTALKLIAEFKTLDGVYENIESPSISKGVREKLLKDKEAAYLSRFLATIETRVPMDMPLEAVTYRGIDEAALYQSFTKYEFGNLIARFHLTGGAASAPEAKGTEKETDTAEEASPAAVCTGDAVCYKEATAEELSSLPGDSLALEFKDGVLYLSTGNGHFLYRGELSAISSLFSGEKTLLCFDAKPIYHLLLQSGIAAKRPLYDLMLAAYVLNSSGGQPTLFHLFGSFLSLYPESTQPTAHLLFALQKELECRLNEIGGLSVLTEIELPLAGVLAEMETRGFRVDTAGLAAFEKELQRAIDSDREAITDMAGISFNINSPKQLGEVLFERLQLPHAKKTKSGYSTDADVLNELRHYHPIIDAILEYRQLSKFRSTYAEGLLAAADDEGLVHTEFKQAVTATGRLSSAEPNLQNIPIRTELGRQFRAYFITKGPEYVLIDADYSQIELRLLAHMSGDETMREAFLNGADIHTRTAAAAFSIPEYAVTPELRKRAKAVNFGIIYGISAYSLSGDLHISVKDAKQYREAYFAQFPKVKGYLDGVVEFAKENGYTETLLGRRRYIPELRAPQFPTRKFGERAAMNSPLQGSAADIIKLAMVAVDRRLKSEGLDAALILQVHDELILEAHIDCAERAKTILREEMENAINLSVPLTVDITTGKTWLESKD